VLEFLLPLGANSMRKPTIVLTLLFAVCLSGVGQNTPAKAVYPRIVKRFQLFNQTATFSPITIYTPKDWGTFRLSASMVRTVDGKNASGVWFGFLLWQDGGGMENSGYTVNMSLPVQSFAGYADAVLTARLKAGTPLQVSVGSNGDTTGSKYNVFVVVERLM
jgi:hypothetical protein